MKRKINKIMSLLSAAALLFTLTAPVAIAAGDTDTIYVHTAEELTQLSRNCTLDSWSQGKTVYLEADIDLTGVDFTSIPTFGGTFQGQGHTISGLSLTGSGNVRGLFRYIQPTGKIYDLAVEGTVDPSGRQNTLGGLAGDNQGLLSGCTFTGTVAGRDSVGGLVGINQAQGQIVGCAFSGTLSGEHYVGGIAGQNYGTILQCENRGSINTTEVDAGMSLDDLNREQLNAAENVPVCTDIGGIAGFSSGILQGCTNAGPVGYAHVGYNIGGIVGRQSGYLDGCTNTGTVLGRKDVGGIAGQLEPEVRLIFNEGQAGDLLDALDTLRTLAGSLRDDLSASSDQLSTRMDAISERAGEAQEVVGELADSAVDWANGNLDEINSLSARLSWLTDEIAPILDDTAGVLDMAEDLAGQLNDMLEEGRAAGEIGAEAASSAENAIRALRSALSQARASQNQLQSALEHLKQVVARGEDTGSAVEALFESFRIFAEDCGEVAGFSAQALRILREAGGLDKMTEEQQAAWNEALTGVRSGLTQAAAALPDVGKALVRLADSLTHPEEFGNALEDVKGAGASLSAAFRALSDAAKEGQDIAGSLRDLLEQGGDVGRALEKVVDTTEELLGQVAGIGRDLADTVEELSKMPTITIHPISEEIQAQGDALGNVFTQLLDDGDALRETMSGSKDLLLDDLDAISAQFGIITDLLRDILEGSDEETERFEDVSDQETGVPDTGAIVSARNSGAVEGDVNTGGIVGSMAIEYDFDPEDDLIREGERSLDFRYQTRAALLSCVNIGTVTGKENYAGGVAGLMDLGRVNSCENYGTVTSINGSYVGGIAGASWGSVRDSWVKCHLSGGDYIGGVAGLGATMMNCRALAAIDEGSAYLGAVAGDVDPDGTVSGNLFTSEALGAVDGISYAGAAEPVEFAALCAAEDAPELFAQLELTFTADGQTVAVIPFRYGEGIDSLPEIPVKKGYSAAWPDLDYTHLTASQILEVIYTPYASSLSDGGELPEILVDGSFSRQASVAHTSETVTWVDADGVSHTGTAYTVAVEDPDLDQTAYTVHYRLPDAGKRYILWVQGSDGWEQADYEQDGQYLLLGSQDESITFCVTERSGSPILWITAAIVAGGVLLLIVLSVRHRRRKK